jgi:uncharacterized protein with HEPN domain
MKADTTAHLHDIIQAADAIKLFTAGKTFDYYISDDILRSAIERKCEIIGEALNRIRRDDADVLEQIRNHREIVSFRNILAHGYDSIDDQIVWDIIGEDLDQLRQDTRSLIQQYQSAEQPSRG